MGVRGVRAGRPVSAAGEHDPAVVGVAIAGIVTVVIDEANWDLFDSMVGLVLALVLLAYGRFRREAVASRWEAAAVGSVWAFCAVLVVGPAIAELPPPRFAEARPALGGFWFAVAWLAGTALGAALLWGAGERLVHPAHRRGPLEAP